MKVLIVDDEKFNLVVGESYVKSYQMVDEVLLCKNPFEVVDIITKENVDIVLLDIVMPEKSGIEVLDEIRSNSSLKDVQVIMVTSISDAESFKLCFDKGADDFLKKPVDQVELQARLKAAIKTRTNSELLKDMMNQVKGRNEELIELNKTLKGTQMQMIQNEKLAAIGGLAAGIAHEINNPMGFIGSNIETLENYINKMVGAISSYRNGLVEAEEIGDEKLNEIVQKIRADEQKYKINIVIDELEGLFLDTRNGVDRVTKIVRTLRNFARTGFEEALQYNSLNTILEEALLILRNETKYSIDITTEFEDLDNVYCNKGQIGQVALNLLVNSIQAIKQGNDGENGAIKIRTFMEGPMFCFSISDNGPGIPHENLIKLFDPFFTTKEVGMGTGLGLSISHDIVANKHKGQIVVENNESGPGAICIVKIPNLDRTEISDEENLDRR